MRSRRLHIMLVLLLLVQPAIRLAYACDMPDTHGDTLVALIDTSESVFSSDLAASPQTEHGSCHDQPTVPEVESGSCDNCPDGMACSSSCSVSASVVSASPAGGVMPDHAAYLHIQTRSQPSSNPTGLYRPPRLS